MESTVEMLELLILVESVIMMNCLESVAQVNFSLRLEVKGTKHRMWIIARTANTVCLFGDFTQTC